MATVKKVKKAQSGISEKKNNQRSYSSSENSKLWAQREREMTGSKGPKITPEQNADSWAKKEREITSSKKNIKDSIKPYALKPLKKGGKIKKAQTGVNYKKGRTTLNIDTSGYSAGKKSGFPTKMITPSKSGGDTSNVTVNRNMVKSALKKKGKTGVKVKKSK